MSNAFKPSDFNRRTYTVEGPELEKARRIEIIIKIDGVEHVHLQAREPGIVAFVSRPQDQGFNIDIVQSGGRRYTDFMEPADMRNDVVLDWQILALGLETGK